MRNLESLAANRLTSVELRSYGQRGDASNGVFQFKSPTDARVALRVIASSGDGWDHVSVSRADRCPSWTEMEFIKRIFFNDDEWAMQLHVAVKEHLNCHPFCLHLWRPLGVDIPRPPSWMVAPERKERA